MKRWMAVVMALCLFMTYVPTRIAAETVETAEESLIPETTEAVNVEEMEEVSEIEAETEPEEIPAMDESLTSEAEDAEEQEKEPRSLDYPGLTRTGEAGENVIWTMYDDGTLVFSGTGAIKEGTEYGVHKWTSLYGFDIKHIVIEEGITRVGSFFTNGNDYPKIETLTLPSTLKSIGNYAFRELLNLKSVHISSLEAWCGVAFDDYGTNPLRNNSVLYLNDTLVEDLVLPKNISTVGMRVFAGCGSIRTIEIPANITTVGYAAFSGCPNLTKVVFRGNAPRVTLPEYAETELLFGKPCTAIIYYPVNNSTWTEAKMQAFAPSATWISYDPEKDDVTSDDFGGGTNTQEYISWTFDEETGVLTISGRGPLDKTPWEYHKYDITRVVVNEGITSIGYRVFYDHKYMESVSLPSTLTCIDDEAFYHCLELASVRLPNNLSKIGRQAFMHTAINSITIPASVTDMEENAISTYGPMETVIFEGNPPKSCADCLKFAKTTAYYPAGNAAWTAEIRQSMGTDITWVEGIHGHSYTITVVDAACDTWGYTLHTCSCGDYYRDNFIPMKEHIFGPWNYIGTPQCTSPNIEYHKCTGCGQSEQRIGPSLGHDWVWTGEQMVCNRCSATRAGYQVEIEVEDPSQVVSAWVDGKEYAVTITGNTVKVVLDDDQVTNLVIYTYNDPAAADPHTKYPIGMRVWTLDYEDGAYTATYVPEFDNLLQYSGSSIRIVGVKGIRMITSIDKSKRSQLINGGLADYTLVEYGTALAWASDLEGGDPLVLGKDYTKSNYAYKRGVADPIFNDTGDLIQYTNVLVGFTDDQCIPDIAMRPYIILENAEGEQITIYGGQILRSIGYIAWQNRNAFQVDSAAYDYVWSIIHHVYGDQFDAEYKG